LDSLEKKPYRKVLVPLDGSKLAECVLPHLDTVAGGCGLENVYFLRVVKPFVPMVDYMGDTISGADVANINKNAVKAAEKYLKQIADKTRYPGIQTHWEVIIGSEAETIADYARTNEMDLIIIATHGRSGVSRWVWGSVADRVLRSFCVPVLMIRAPGCAPGI
jgi:nucleotide-binding universal stress UspA family protein